MRPASRAGGRPARARWWRSYAEECAAWEVEWKERNGLDADALSLDTIARWSAKFTTDAGSERA